MNSKTKTPRGLVIENVNDKGSISVATNTFTSCTFAGIEGRDFTNCVIVGNTVEGLPIQKTFSNTTDNTWYGIDIVNGGKKVVIANNNLQNMKVNGMQLFNCDEYVIEGNRISGVVDSHGIFIKNSGSGQDMKTGAITSNVINDVAIGIYVKKDNGDAATLNNTVIASNSIRFRGVGIQVEYVSHFVIAENAIQPITSYAGSVGIRGIGLFRCRISGNLVPFCATGLDINGDDSSYTSNQYDTCSTSIRLTNCTNTMLADFVRGGTTAIASVSGNSGVNGRGVVYSGVITNIKTGFNVSVIIYGSAAPTSGNWDKGDVCINNSPDAGEYGQWRCVTSGTPGVWNGESAIAA